MIQGFFKWLERLLSSLIERIDAMLNHKVEPLEAYLPEPAGGVPSPGVDRQYVLYGTDVYYRAEGAWRKFFAAVPGIDALLTDGSRSLVDPSDPDAAVTMDLDPDAIGHTTRCTNYTAETFGARFSGTTYIEVKANPAAATMSALEMADVTHMRLRAASPGVSAAGIALTVAAGGGGASAGAGGALALIGGESPTAAGGNASLSGGTGPTAGGAVSLVAGDANVATGAQIRALGATQTGDDVYTGGAVTLAGGVGDGGASGGIVITAGARGTAAGSAAGTVTMAAGSGGAGNAAGGLTTVLGGAGGATGGVGGALALSGGAAQGGNSLGGAASLTGGAGVGSGDGGGTSAVGGRALGSGNGGVLAVYGGDADGAGDGGAVEITGGFSSAGTGGAVIISAGTGGFASGAVSITNNDEEMVFPASGTDQMTSSTGAHLTLAGVWTSVSDAAKKENFRPADHHDVLARLVQLPVTFWNFIVEGSGTEHLGPTAQDFKGAFGLGQSDKSINPLDAQGVAYSAIKALHELVLGQARKIASLEAHFV